MIGTIFDVVIIIENVFSYRAISENTQLDELNLCMCKGLTTSGITALVNKCKR